MDFAFRILASLSALLIDPQIPAPSADWTVDHKWQVVQDHLELQASSTSVVQQCHAQPNGFLSLPIILQGFHEVYLDSRLVLSTGDPTFSRGTALYNRADVPCHLLENGNTVTWKVTNLTHAYSNIFSWPVVNEK